MNKFSKLLKLIWALFLRYSKSFGLDFRQFMAALRNTPRFIREYHSYKKLYQSSSESGVKGFPTRLIDIFPCLTDYNDKAGGLGSYFHQDLWAARKVYKANPQQHIDIGSRIDGFIGHLLVFRDVSVVDVRELTSTVPGLEFVQADATNLQMFPDNSVSSISSLHAAEHFGLGRYGDDVDPTACFKFMKSLQRVLKKDGRLLFSVPIGTEKLMFNAHRMFAPQTIINAFDELTLVSFSAVTRDDRIAENTNPEDYIKHKYTVGLFEFTKE